MFILFCLWGINKFFFTEETQDARYTVQRKDVTEKDNSYYLKLNKYNLKLPKKYYKKIESNPTDYKISYNYNSLFKKGEVLYLEKYGSSYKGH